MPIIGLQIKLQERGRIRIGKQVETKGGKKAPRALDKFRITSRDRSAIEAAAKAFGGKVEQWDNNGRKEWQVETEADALPVLLPPSELGFSQWYELWSAGGCHRRCTGPDDVDNPRAETISDGPCLCNRDDPECDPTTRLSVMLPDVPGFGLWRLDTQGINAAMEMLGAYNTLKLLAVNGQIIPGTLRLDQRSIKRPDEPIKRFVVPWIDFDVTPLLPGGERKAALTAVPASAAPPNIEQQMKAVESIESKRTRAAEIRPTGIAPRTATQVAADAPTKSGRGGTYDSRVSDDPWPPNPTVVKVSGEFTPEPSTDPTAVARNDVAANDDPEQGSGYNPPTPEDATINQRQLGIIGHLFDLIGVERGDKPRLNWCIKQIGHSVSHPGELKETEAIALISKLTMLHTIRTHYQTDDMQLVLVDLTEYLQRDTKLRSIDELTDDEIASTIEAIEMSEETGNRILGLNIETQGAPDEATIKPEQGQP